MSNIRIMLDVGVPDTQKAEPVPKGYKPSVEDQIREAIDCIDSGHDSRVEWMLLNRMYKNLKALKKPNDRAKNLIEMIEQVLSKFGYHEVSANQFNGN